RRRDDGFRCAQPILRSRLAARSRCTSLALYFGVPSPLAGEGQGGGWPWKRNVEGLSLTHAYAISERNDTASIEVAATPPPNPPPQGGREPSGGCRTTCASRASRNRQMLDRAQAGALAPFDLRGLRRQRQLWPAGEQRLQRAGGFHARELMAE